MRRPKAVWVNTGLAVLLGVAALGAYLSIGDPPRAQTTAGRRVTAQVGTVTATVTGTGNAASATTSAVNFATGGTLSEVDVQPGQKVTAGQVLARIDPTSAQQSLQSAQAQLATAQASYDQTVNGGTAIQQQKDQLAIRSAQLGVSSAQNSLAAAQQQLATDTTQQNQLVAQAQADQKSGKGTAAQVTQAQNTRTNLLAKDQQAITQAQQQLSTANNQLAQQRLTATADSTPTPSAVAQAQQQLTSARIAVAQAQKAVDQTALRAPQAGTVVSVSAKVGQVVSGGGSSSTSSSGTGSGGSSGGGSAGSSGSSGNGSGSASSSSTSGTGSGLVLIADLATMTVTANIAEADAASVKVGQSASATFSATGTTVGGKVTAVSLSSITSNNVIQYPITVTLANVPAAVRLGATANVSITTGSVDDALYVPSSAVTSLGQTHTVTVVRGTAQTVVPVQIGLVGDRGTQITSGLSEGDVVVLPTTTSTSTTGGFPRLTGGLGIGGGRG